MRFRIPARSGLQQRDIGRLDRHVGSARESDPDICLASAGASFTPSPAIATILPCFWSSLTFAALSSGMTSAKTWSIPSCSATALGRRLVIAGHHNDLDPLPMQFVDRGLGRRLDGVGHADQAGRSSVDGSQT